MKIAILATRSPAGEQGGAERFYQGLCSALNTAGADAEIVSVVSDERDFRHVQESYLRFYDLDLSRYDGVISTKAPGYVVKHDNHVCYLQHTMRVFYDMFDVEFPAPTAELVAQRNLVHALDTAALSTPRTRRVFTISQEVSNRLKQDNGLDAEVLYQASTLTGLRSGDFRYVFMPGRLHRWKRVDLVIRAMQFVQAPVQLVISGTGEDEAALRSLAGQDPRIRFVGRVTDEELLGLYADALAVAFVPVREDFGLVTLESFHSRKPVITCTDSGEPSRIVQHGRTGFVCGPNPQDIAAAVDQLAGEPALARRMGEEGEKSIRGISWTNVADKLIQALEPGVRVDERGRRRNRSQVDSAKDIKVAVFDMQPIDPPVGGGRLRLLGLYHALGCPTTYVGTYDWPGPKFRDHMLSESLREIDVPLSEEHHALAKALSFDLGGKVVIDAAFHRHAKYSQQYHETAMHHLAEADVVVFSHPWIYTQCRDRVERDRQLLVYDAHNVEGYLRYTLLDDRDGPGSQLCREVAQIEWELCRNADLVLACSHSDRELFHRLYDLPYSRISVVPNGVFTAKIRPRDATQKRASRAALGFTSRCHALFLGSSYQPNVEAAEFILGTLAAALPEIDFVIAGGVGNALAHRPEPPKNVRITGDISEEDKLRYLEAADIAVNPMFAGSGTNIKMLEFMAAGLPIVTTPVGARGLRKTRPMPFVEVPGDAMAAEIKRLFTDTALRQHLSEIARREAVEAYSWERISADLGRLIVDAVSSRGVLPKFSVVIPTFDRPAHLSALMERIERQSYRNFEVIVVDQSMEPWSDAQKPWNVNLRYYHTDIKGAVSARNKGGFFAQGEVIAFVDDDCLPEDDWLEAARRYFHTTDVVGLEGIIVSDKYDDPDFRPVSNANLRGLGFMTANFFVRREVFNALDGFDPVFDRPHFREDTDFGWRVLEFGSIPFAEDVIVFHPPHPRSIERESEAARVRFFEKDALLIEKHPERYKLLFLAECHWKNTPGFWEHFLRGHKKYGVPIDPFFLDLKAKLPADSPSASNTGRGS